MGKFHRRGNAAVHKRHKIADPEKQGNVTCGRCRGEEEEEEMANRKWWTYEVKCAFTGENKKEAKKKAKAWFKKNCVKEMEMTSVKVEHYLSINTKLTGHSRHGNY